MGRYYVANQSAIDGRNVRTLAFDTGLDAERRYPAQKIIDMVFFQEGINIDLARKAQACGSQQLADPE